MSGEVVEDAVGGGARRGDTGGDADAVKGRPGDVEGGQPREVVTDASDTLDVAEGVLRQTVRPALDVGVERGGKVETGRLA